VRFLIGPWSYAAGTPGGLFAPLLAVGMLFGGVAGISPLARAVIGMGAFFAATVRAPLTGIALTVEMTGRGDLTLGLLEATLTAMLVAMLLGNEPIYATLKRRMLEREAPAASAAPAGQPL
jgi:chloride channel protein, CIC family